jgi:hypothetical protein
MKTPFVLVALSLAAGSASAQATRGVHKWEIEVHGGAMLATNPTGGSGTLPPPGPAITFPFQLPGRTSESRQVSSWYFGEGASLFNRAAASISSILRATGPIAPLDPVLESGLVERQSGGTAGVRISRALTSRYAAEFSFDYSAGTLELTRESVAGLESTRGSFVTAWRSILTAPAMGTESVSSVTTIADRQGRQLFTTGTFLIELKPAARVRPYAALGAGVASPIQDPPSVTLAGDYRFGLMFPPGLPTPVSLPRFHETDTVTVRSSAGNMLTWVVGGGVKYATSTHWGLRMDVRDHISRNSIRTRVEAAPVSEALTPFGTLTLGTDPPLLFSTGAGFPSNLSLPLAAFETFRGTGLEHHISVAVGLFRTF